MKTERISDKLEFTRKLKSTLQELSKIPIDEKSDEVSIPVYLHNNFLVKWIFINRFKVAYRLANFKNKTVLDYGCGSGLFLQSLSSEITKGIGVDLDITIAKKIINQNNIELIQINNERDIEKISNVDIITSFDVLEHVTNLDLVLKLFDKILLQTGKMIISGPTENSFYKIARKIANIGIRGNLKGGDEHVRDIFDIKMHIIKSNWKLEKDINLIGLFHVMIFRKK